jgi:hypothetical protein
MAATMLTTMWLPYNQPEGGAGVDGGAWGNIDTNGHVMEDYQEKSIDGRGLDGESKKSTNWIIEAVAGRGSLGGGKHGGPASMR